MLSLFLRVVLQKVKWIRFPTEEEDSNIANASDEAQQAGESPTLPFGDHNPEFEPLILVNNRRKSLGDLSKVPPSSGQGKDFNAASQANKVIRGLSDDTSEEGISEEEDDWSSSDEIYAKMFPDKVKKDSYVPLPPQRRSTRQSNKKVSSGKKKGGRTSLSKPTMEH